MPNLVVLAEQLLAPVPGGTGRYTRELLVAMAAKKPDGWTLSSVTARHRDLSAASVPGVAGPRSLMLPRKALTAVWERGLALWPGGDVVHAPTPLAPPRAPRGRRLVVTVHDTVPFTHPETLTPRGALWHRAAINLAVRYADAIVVPTEAVAGSLRRFAPGPAEIHVIGHGVPAALLRSSNGPISLPDAYVLAVGTIEPRKGIDVLIKAMTLPGAPDLPLVLAGPVGWGGVDPAALAASVGLPAGRLHVLGRITDAELAMVLRGASVLAAPSLAEGFGLPVLEAMAVGVPVVHSDDPSLVEVAAGTGVVVPRGDAAALAVALGQVAGTTADPGARVRAAEFTWEAAAASVWELHEKTAG